MSREINDHRVSADGRRDFLKAVGIGGAIAGGGTSLHDVHEALSAGDATADLASLGEAITADLTGTLDAQFISDQQTALVSAAGALSEFPEGETTAHPGTTFAAIAAEARPVHEHFVDTGFFESTSEHLPSFDREYMAMSVETVVGSENLLAPLDSLGMGDEDGVDLLATVVANAERVNERHWATSDTLSRQQFEFAANAPPMTQAVAGGALLWFESLDDFLWTNAPLVTDQIEELAAWYGQAMAAGFQLLAEGARDIGADSPVLSAGERGAALSTGIAAQAIAQQLLLPDVAWITDDVRAPHRTDLEVVTRAPGAHR